MQRGDETVLGKLLSKRESTLKEVTPLAARIRCEVDAARYTERSSQASVRAVFNKTEFRLTSLLMAINFHLFIAQIDVIFHVGSRIAVRSCAVSIDGRLESVIIITYRDDLSRDERFFAYGI